MDISGPLRSFLRANVPAEPASAEPLAFLAQRLAHPERATSEMPAFLEKSAPPVLHGQFARPAHGYLAFASAIRAVPLIGRHLRPLATATLLPQLEYVRTAAEKLLLSRTTPPFEYLWHHYLLVMGQVRFDLPMEDTLLTGLWRRAWGLFQRQQSPWPLHPASGESSLEGSVYNDLTALHAAFNAVLLLQDHDRLDLLEKLVRWHVENTQPDNTTTEPWALAAFAALDDTQTFAPQQMHDATQASP
ncbi:MAG TPA: hypothetical protein VHM90_02050, partial [Phycisphaerae bacterium]|nr:hypothetical protein [Phycisphaerae bacterium]